MTELSLEDFRFVQHKHDEDPANLAHFIPDETGLPQSVWLSRAGGEHATGRIPVRIAGPQDPASLDLLLGWIKRHRVAIHDYWRGRIGTVDLMHSLDLFSQP